jgi:hypothetical protein
MLMPWSSIGQLAADATGSMTYGYTIEPVTKGIFRFKKP